MSYVFALSLVFPYVFNLYCCYYTERACVLTMSFLFPCGVTRSLLVAILLFCYVPTFSRHFLMFDSFFITFSPYCYPFSYASALSRGIQPGRSSWTKAPCPTAGPRRRQRNPFSTTPTLSGASFSNNLHLNNIHTSDKSPIPA